MNNKRNLDRSQNSPDSSKKPRHIKEYNYNNDNNSNQICLYDLIKQLDRYRNIEDYNFYLKEEIDKLEKQLKDEKTKNESLIKELNAEKTENENLNDKNFVLTEKLDDKIVESNAKETKSANLIKKLNDEKSNLIKEFKNSNKKLNDENAELKAKYVELNAKNEELNAKNVELNAKETESANSIKKLNNEKDNLIKELKAKDLQNLELDEKIKTIDQNLGTLQTLNNDLEQNLRNEQVKVAKLEKDKQILKILKELLLNSEREKVKIEEPESFFDEVSN